ncbi:hypothetical protein BAUCODRAFT_30219 [Baudoinia panamericana UAMH 10762]|uniref:Uncharacterized protein n=1 Tax=Baudoinia panamericana (strain UAMH 10762) TaxID=717646 RepID=M2NK48_BAUPA|nr:uncharacterized protein BAUCODRAFT_30219 [Baudoinia panamericana UAMH 10762]EMC99809.1 hypothetical protein BAUCODRAFT_30219 [Baudoinia panamericana UAMH 10762]
MKRRSRVTRSYSAPLCPSELELSVRKTSKHRAVPQFSYSQYPIRTFSLLSIPPITFMAA